jgi:diguanylate cyclase (GGDEF)-like protein
VWSAVLTLTLVPTLAALYLAVALLSQPTSTLAAERVRDSSQAAADLLAREQAIETRLLVAAADPGIAKVANGIAGATDREHAARLLRGLRGADGAAIVDACIVRASDGSRTLLSGSGNGGASSACAGGALRRAAAAQPDTVTRGRLGDDAGRLLLATPLRSVNERNSGVLSVELDVTALFDRVRPTAGDAVSSMLVDMGSSEVVATSPATAGPVEGVAAQDIEAVLPLLGGIVAEDSSADAELAAMGLSSAVVPLWPSGDGSRMGLLQLWANEPSEMPLDVRLALLVMIAGAVAALIVLVRFILKPYREMAELRELYLEAREDALADGLTGIGNHRAFQEGLARQVQSFERRGTPFSLVLVDLDDLKVVNDREGHAAGDEMLRSLARAMRELSRPLDRLYRTGGDEFAMLLPDTSIEEATKVAERVLHFTKRPAGDWRPCTFSGGISGVPWFTRQRDTVYRQADAALYWAKRHGRASIEVFDPERDQLPEELDDATSQAVQEIITGRLLRPVFQPIVDLRSGRILGFEGLIRPDPSGPLPDTTRLFAAAAAAGRTVELDLACIEAVVQGARAIGPDRLLTLNLSPRTLEVKDFDAAWLLRGLVQNGISPSRVILELTEREEVDDLMRLRRTFADLQQYGLRLAADDVGAGNSGLRLLSQVQFDIVKIDLALVQDGVRRTGARAVLESLRDLALSQNARIVAEGVETARQLRVIRELEIGAGQGFLLGRPDASLDVSYVDVRGLEVDGSRTQSEPVVLTPDAEPIPTGAVAAGDVLDIPADRRAIFLPPASTLEAEAGSA